MCMCTYACVCMCEHNTHTTRDYTGHFGTYLLTAGVIVLQVCWVDARLCAYAGGKGGRG